MSAMMATRDAYKAHLEDLPTVADKLSQGAIMPISVAKCIENILKSNNPNARYLLGWEAWTVPIIFKLIPDKLRDTLISKLFNILRKK